MLRYQFPKFILKKLVTTKSKIHATRTNIRYYGTGTSLIKTTEQNGIKEILLNDPKTRNSLSMAMMLQLHEQIIKDENNEKIRVIVITGEANSIFSAGHDLKELTEERGTEYHKSLFQKLTQIVTAIRAAPIPIIAKIDGPIIGAGCQLVASCDMLICSNRTTFSLAATDYGLFASTPAVAITRVMPRMKSADLLISGLPMSANEAYISGLVSYLTSAENLDQHVNKICNSILKKSYAVMKLGKQFYYKQLEMENLCEAYQAAENIMIENLQMHDGQEGVRSFIEKRPPLWRNS